MDILSKSDRSRRMSAVRSKGNRSTEWRLRAVLVRRGVRDWTMHDAQLPGAPDFVFARLKVAVFVDGCFWHGCPRCDRPMPQTNAGYWRKKIDLNKERARRVTARLRAQGFQVLRVWEHQLRSSAHRVKVLNKLSSLRAQSRP